MIVYAQPQNAVVKRNEDYHRLQPVNGNILIDSLTIYFKWLINKLSIFTEIDFRTQQGSWKQVKNSVIALMIALLQGVK